MSQKEMIIDYINRFQSITPMQAFSDLGITKLATRVSELKRDGVKIKTETVKSKNRFGKTTYYSKYSMGVEG